MKKSEAIDLLGGSVSKAAAALDVTVQAVNKWPDDLPLRIADRVRGAYARSRLPELATPTDTQTAEPTAHGVA
jgi:hypothetical protein